jgi:hypothetical protein
MAIIGLLEAVCAVGSAPNLYNEDTSQAAVSCQQFSWVKWHEVAGWWVREFSWKSAYEEKTRRFVWNGHQPGTQLVEGCQLRGSSVWEVVKKRAVRVWLWQENLSAGSWRISLGRSHCQERVGGDCNWLSTLVCVCQWSVKCSSKWCVQVVNKSNSPIPTPSSHTTPNPWQ